MPNWQAIKSKANRINAAAIVKKGGPGSGNFGHAGRHGKVGGSTSRHAAPPMKTQGKLFPVGDYTDPFGRAVSYAQKMGEMGLTPKIRQRLNDEGVDQDFTIAVLSGTNYLTADDVIDLWNAHGHDAAIGDLLGMGLNYRDLENLSLYTDKFDSEFLARFNQLVRETRLSPSDAVKWAYFIPGGGSEVSAANIPAFIHAGVQSPEVIENLILSGANPQAVKAAIAGGLPESDTDILAHGFTPEQFGILNRYMRTEDYRGNPRTDPFELGELRKLVGEGYSANAITAAVESNMPLQIIPTLQEIQDSTGIDDIGVFSEGLNFLDDSGMAARVESMSPSSEVDGVAFLGRIWDDAGLPVGVFRRDLDTNGTVYHHGLQLLSDERSQGFGYDYYRHLEEHYLQSGIKDIQMQADMDVGGYAWARMGYDFTNEATREKFRTEFARLVASKEDSSEASAATYFRVKHNNYHSWDIAAYTMPDGTRFGKEYMLGTSWQAQKTIDPTSLGWKVGQAYYRSKDEEYGR